VNFEKVFVLEKAIPIARRGRKATGLKETAGLPKDGNPGFFIPGDGQLCPGLDSQSAPMSRMEGDERLTPNERAFWILRNVPGRI